MYYLNKITHYLYAEVNKMPQLTPLLADVSASVTELKKDPMGIIRNGLGETVVILNRNEPAFYAVPPAQYELMMQLIDDMYLVDLAKQRQDEPVTMVDIDELIQQTRWDSSIQAWI